MTGSHGSQPFLTTRWTRVCLAKEASEDGRRALAELCEAYYEPVVALPALRTARCGGGARVEPCVFRADARRRADSIGGPVARALPVLFARRGETFRWRSPAGGGAAESAAAESRPRRSMDDAEARAGCGPFAGCGVRAAVGADGAGTGDGESLEGECAAGGTRRIFSRTVKPLLTGDADHGGQARGGGGLRHECRGVAHGGAPAAAAVARSV